MCLLRISYVLGTVGVRNPQMIWLVPNRPASPPATSTLILTLHLSHLQSVLPTLLKVLAGQEGAHGVCGPGWAVLLTEAKLCPWKVKEEQLAPFPTFLHFPFKHNHPVSACTSFSLKRTCLQLFTCWRKDTTAKTLQTMSLDTES